MRIDRFAAPVPWAVVLVYVRNAALMLVVVGGLPWWLASSASAQSTSAPTIDEPSAHTVPEGTTTVATLTATDDDTADSALSWSIAGGADQAKFSLTQAGALSFGAAKDYEAPDDADADGVYELSVTVSDGAGTDTASLTVELENVIELTAVTGPTSASFAENSWARVATYSASSDADKASITWSLTGTDSGLFSIDSPAGALRFDLDAVSPAIFSRPPDFENAVDSGADNVYNVTVTAAAGGSTMTSDVTVTVTDADDKGSLTVSSSVPTVGTALTATLSDPDRAATDAVSWKWQRNNGREGWLDIPGASGSSYTPTGADGDRYLRAEVAYTDKFGSDKTLHHIVPNVVIAHRLSALSLGALEGVTGDDRAFYPTFASDTLHYAARCVRGLAADGTENSTYSVTMTATVENTSTRMSVDGVRRSSGVPFTVSGLDGHSDIKIELTGDEGGATTYWVHCMRPDFPKLVTRPSTGATDELFMFSTKWSNGYLGVSLVMMDKNGVPRYRKSLPRDLFAYFRVHPDANHPRAYYSYNTHGNGAAPRDPEVVVVMDKYFEVLDDDVHIRSPYNNTDVHDQTILANGNRALLAYSGHRHDLRPFSDRYPDVRHAGGAQFGSNDLLQDSVLQVQRPNETVVFNWSSWDNMALEDCMDDDLSMEWAHVNSVSVYDGDLIASFRGCSKILRIDMDTGDVVWRAGPSIYSRQEWDSGATVKSGLGPAPLDFVNDPRGGFSGQHGGRITYEGTLVVFDNATHCDSRPPGLPAAAKGVTECFERTRAVEYAFDTDNHELVFMREARRSGASQGGWGGHAEPMSNGDWVVSWSQPGRNAVPETAVQVDAWTGARKLAFDVTLIYGSRWRWGPRVARVGSINPVALAERITGLEASFPVSDKTAVIHTGTADRPKVVVSFNRPIVDLSAASPSLQVQGATVESVAAHSDEGAPANSYVLTLNPSGGGEITVGLRTGQQCTSLGVCTADGTQLTAVPQSLKIVGPVQATFSRSAARVTEGGTLRIPVRLSAAHKGARDLMIPVVAAASSTAETEDYTLDGAVAFGANTAAGSLTIIGLDDMLVEGDETVVVEFGALPSGVTAGTTTSTTITVGDADRAVFTVSAGQAEVAEGAGTKLTYTVSNGVTYEHDQTISLSYSGTAVHGSDYSAASTATLAGGTASVDVDLSVTDDADIEAVDETIVVRATIGAGATPLPAQTVTIPPSDLPDASIVSISAGGTVPEGSDVEFTLQRTPPRIADPLTVAVRLTAEGAVLAGSVPTRVTFAAGSASAQLRVSTRADTVVGSAGTVNALVLGSDASPPSYLTDSANSASVELSDNDVAQFTVTPVAQSVHEGRAATVRVRTGGVTFTRSEQLAVTVGGTATEGADYRLLDTDRLPMVSPYSVTLPAGSSQAAFLVDVMRDSDDDAEESIVVTVTHAGAAAGEATITTKAPLAAAPQPSVSSIGGGGGGTAEPPPEEDPAGEPQRFTDVSPGNVHAPGIAAVAAAGITVGCGTEPLRYCPGQPVTRAQMATFLTRALDLPAGEPGRFADVSPGNVHAPGIAAVAAAGITVGCGTEPLRYCPGRSVTRAQMATFLTRALDLPAGEPGRFADVSPGGVHAPGIAAVAAAGITVGCGTEPLRYCPGRPVTRAQMATFLTRALQFLDPA